MDLREKLILWIQDSVGGCARHWAEVIADGLIANGVTVQEWIPVTERLPGEDEDVWALCRTVQVLLKDGTVTVGFCNRGLKRWYHVPILATTFNGHSYSETPVIAWQPLSYPPKES